jgi:protein TonB
MVVAATLSADRLPAPSTREPRASMALSFALHGLALVPLLFAGASGSVSSEEPALLVEISLAAPAPTPAATIDVPLPDQPPPVEASELAPNTVELPSPEEPPPVDSAELKPIDPPPPPPKPQPQPQPRPKAPPTPAKATPRPAPKPAMTQTATVPDAGTAQITQTAAAAPSSAIVWEHHPRFRIPPRPAVYPPRAIELGHQGEALVRVRLDSSGSAAEIVLWRGTGFELLDKAAMAAVRGWQFMPAMRNGHAVAAWVEIPVRFHLR